MSMITITCPGCGLLIEVETAGGKVVGHRKAQGKLSFDETLKRLEEEKAKRSGYFEKAAGEMEEKKKKAREAFDKGVEKIKKEGLGEPPPRPFDLD